MNIKLLIEVLSSGGFLVEAEHNDNLGIKFGPRMYENSPNRELERVQKSNPENERSQEYPFPKPLNSRDFEDWEKGLDTLAWYVPYHQSLDQWGIYIRARGVEIFAASLVSAGADWNSATNHAFDMLLAHEMGHFKTEVLVSAHEISENRRVYLAGLSREEKLNNWNHIEEAICSALEFSETTGLRTPTRKVLNRAPEGYRDWFHFDMKKPESCWGQVLGTYLSGTPIGWASINQRQVEIEYHKLRKVTLVLDGSEPDGGIAGNFTRES